MPAKWEKFCKYHSISITLKLDNEHRAPGQQSDVHSCINSTIAPGVNGIRLCPCMQKASLVAQMVKRLPAMRETQV